MTTIARPKAPSNYHITVFYNRFARFANAWQSPLLLLIRAYIGYQCLLSGWTLLHDIHGTTENFAAMHIPHPLASAYLSATTQLVGGAFLFAGFCSRFTALALAFNFFVAIFATQFKAFGFTLKTLGDHIRADQSLIFSNPAFPFFAAAILILFFGPGWLSIDGIFKFIRGKKL